MHLFEWSIAFRGTTTFAEPIDARPDAGATCLLPNGKFLFFKGVAIELDFAAGVPLLPTEARRSEPSLSFIVRTRIE